jgi:hypothetical protein
MAESRISAFHAIFKPWYVKAGSGVALLLAAVNGYAGVEDQFPSLPKLQDVVTMTHVGILPWWGWLLVLQSVFVYALFEYVRVKMPGTPSQPIAVPTTPSTQAHNSHAFPAIPAPKGAPLGAWEHVNRFKVSEAANLWVNHLPGASFIYDKTTRPAVVGAERLIVSELDSVLDKSEVAGYSSDYADAYVTRADLLSLAEKKGVRPVFLYPNG